MAVNREKSIGVYKLVNTRNGKEYAGSTNDLLRREAEHFYYLKNNKHYNKHLQRAFNKDSFEFKVVYLCDTREEAADIELQYIRKKDLTKKGYNKAKYAWTPATFKISEGLKGKKLSKKHRENLKGSRPHTAKSNHHSVKVFHIYDKNTKAYLGNWDKGATYLAELLGFTRTAITNNISGYNKSCGDFIFSYKLLGSHD